MDDHDEAEAPSALPRAPAMSAFNDVGMLLKVISDEKACAKRLAQLRAATLACEKAQADLATARAEHDAFVSKERAQIERDREKLREREIKVAADQSNLAVREKHLETLKREIDVRLGREEYLGGTLTRSFSEDAIDRPRERDAHFKDDVIDPGFELPAGSTLTRSSPRATNITKFRRSNEEQAP
jgi:hypothetical protein